MRQLKSTLAIVFFLLIALSNPVSAQDGRMQMFTETTSPSGLSETVKKFKEEVTANGWSILNMTNMAGILSERGFTVAPVLIFDVCSGKYSAAILSKDEFRFVTPIMPCRVSIYQTSTGKVVIGRMNAKAFAPMFEKELADVILQSANDVERIIEDVVKKLAAKK